MKALLGAFSVATAVAALACNAERVEIEDPPAESGRPAPTPRTSDDYYAPAAPPAPAPSPSQAPSAPPPARTLGTLGGLLDFDFDDTTLVLGSASGLHACPVDACGTPRPLVGGPRAQAAFALAGGRVFFDDARAAHDHDLASVSSGGGEARTEATYGPFTAQATFLSLHGGESVYGLLRRTPIADAGRFEHVLLSAPSRAENHARIGHVTPNLHTNRGARVTYTPAERPSLFTNAPWAFEVVGASVPRPAVEPLAVGVSPFSPAPGHAVHPTVVVRRGEHLDACPVVAGRCEAWIDLGAMTGTFALDDGALYVGNERGLSACSLAELAASGACTFAPLSDEPVSAPLYATATELVFVHGSDVRAVRLPN